MKHIAVDFDGTLVTAPHAGAEHHPIGTPVKPMIDRVKRHLARGGKVTIFSARAESPAQRKLLEDWTEKHLGKRLPVTNVKRPEFEKIYDDRAVRVNRNKGTLA